MMRSATVSERATEPLVLTAGETMALLEAVHEPRIESGSRFVLRIAGAESNVAIGLTRLGIPVTFVSRVGDDVFGELVVDTLRQEGVDVRYVERDPHAPTGVFLKWHRGTAPEIRYFREGSAASHLSPANVPEAAFNGIGAVHLTGITLALSRSCQDLVFHVAERAHALGLIIVFDPNFRDALWKSPQTAFETQRPILKYVDWYLCGLEEGQDLVGAEGADELWRSLRSEGVRRACIRVGRRGVFVCEGSEITLVPPTRIREVVDEVGAGDGFAAGFVYGLLRNWTPLECARAGNIVARAALGNSGDWENYPDQDEFRAEFSSPT